MISNVIRSYTISSMMENGCRAVMRSYVNGLDLRLRRRMKRKGSSIGMRCGYLSRGVIRSGHGSKFERRSKSGWTVELLVGEHAYRALGIAAKYKHITGEMHCIVPFELV